MSQEMDAQKMGKYIQGLRTTKKMTQKDLGQLIGISDKAISKWELGLSFPDITLLPRLAEVFEVSAGELIAGESLSISEESREEIKKVVNKTMEYTVREHKRTARNLAMIFSAIAGGMGILACLIVNIVLEGTISWALYIVGGVALALALLAACLYAGKNRVAVLTLICVLGTIPYLFLVQALSNTGNWALPIGVPITLLSGAFVFAGTKAAITMKNKWMAAALCSLLVAILQLSINGILVLNGINSDPQWINWLNSAAFVVATGVLFIIGKRRAYKGNL